MPKEKENQTARVEFLLTPADKERLAKYAQDNFMKISQVVKKCVFELLTKEGY